MSDDDPRGPLDDDPSPPTGDDEPPATDADGPRRADPATVEALFDRDAPIEPGRPSLENAAFVLLGVLVALAVIARLVLLFA